METEQTISQIVAEVASALKDAAAEYGPQAADLALLAYRVDAIKSLMFIPIAAAMMWCLWRAWLLLYRVSEGWVERRSYGDDTFPRSAARCAGVLIFGGAGVLTAATAVGRLIDIPLWMAAFGTPELLIATRALQAAGLM